MRCLMLISVLVLAGCTSSATISTTGGGGTVTLGSASEEQRRASVRPTLRRAGVSEDCINSLSGSELGQVKAFTAGKRARTSREVIVRNQQIRTFVGRYCDPVR